MKKLFTDVLIVAIVIYILSDRSFSGSYRRLSRRCCWSRNVFGKKDKDTNR